MDTLDEQLLAAWMALSRTINNERMATRMPYNAAQILRVLVLAKGERLTATDLCDALMMQKSQMNRSLTYMEEKGWIERERASEDKRQIYIRIKDNPLQIYEEQHDDVIGYVGDVAKKLGDEKTATLVALVNEVVEIINEKEGRKNESDYI